MFRDEKTILYRKLSSPFACGALKLSHTISANHGGSILRGNLSVRNIIARRTKSCLDGYSRGIGLLEFTHIIAFHRKVSNFRHMQDAVSLLCIRSLYIRTILHDVLSPSFVNHDTLLPSAHALTSRFSFSHFARFNILSMSNPF